MTATSTPIGNSGDLSYPNEIGNIDPELLQPQLNPRSNGVPFPGIPSLYDDSVLAPQPYSAKLQLISNYV